MANFLINGKRICSNHMGALLILLGLKCINMIPFACCNFFTDFEVTWAPSKVTILDSGASLNLMLDQNSGK